MDCLCRPSRIMAVRINLLDETDFIHEIKDDLPGQALLDVVFGRLNLIETSYFGIRYIDEENQTHWLDPASRISRQLKPKADPFDLYFGVKFYTADPCKLLEEITRYQLFLQVKQDVLHGRLPVSFELAAELGAFVVQSELGDYDQRRHSKGYVSEFRLLPNQSSELETRVAELHQQLKGMSPASAELNYLDKVKWHDMYGVDLHPVLGEDSVEYFLGLTPSGIVVLRNKTTVAHYYWPRIAKVYYKGRYFMLRISDKNNELNTYGFETPRKPACKHLWRCCVEHHAFFRLVRVAPLPNSQSSASDLFQLGTRLRYGGRAEKQSVKDALSIGRTPPAFTRVPSKRQPRRMIDDFLSVAGKNAESFSASAGVNVHGKGGGGGGGVGLLPTSSSTMPMNFESPYLSTYSIPTSLNIRPYHQQHGNSNYHSNNNNNSGGSNLQTPDSPRSTRSAPWPRTQQRSLFGNNPPSPRSVRSASTTGGGGGTSGHHHNRHQQQQHQNQTHHHSQQHHHHHHHHGGTAASTSSSHQQRYRSSSVESHSSNDSRSTRRNKHRHRRTSDNESELSRGSGRSGRSHHRKHRRSRHQRGDSAGSDHESTRGRSYSGHRISSSGRSAGSAELIDSTSQWREVQRRQAEASMGQTSVQQASVSKSSMVARSLHSNDSHSDTHSHHKSRRHRKNKSPSDSRYRIWNSELAKHLQFGLVDTTGMTEDQLREIPYTVVETNSKRTNSNLKIHKSSSKSSVGGKSNGSGNTLTNGSGGGNSNSGQGKNRVDRIRGLYFQSSNQNDSNGTKNGSIRSASTISSRECERNNGLVRMMSSMSMGDFISPTGSNLSPLENSALRVSHEHTDSGLGADQDYAYSSERSSDSTRYGTNKSSGASSGSHRKSACGSNNSAGAGTSTYNSIMAQTVSNQQQKRNNSFYASHQRQPGHTKYPPLTNPNSSSLAPVHHNQNHSVTSQLATNNNNNSNSHTNNDKNASATTSYHSTSSANSAKVGNSNRLLNYTTFENNQYKFSLNNVFGGKNSSTVAAGNTTNTSHLDSLLEMPYSAAAPYYYNGPPTTNVHLKKRDAKSDIGVPTRRGSSSSSKPITKTQLLTGQAPGGVGFYPSMASPSYGGGNSCLVSRLHPAKSDLFLSYIHSTTGGAGEFERPHIYNYKMPQMPEFMRQQQQQQQQQKTPSTAAYHISGAQTSDLPPLYKPSTSGVSGGASGMLYAGAVPSNDVVYYQFDAGQHPTAPIVQQPKASAKSDSHSGTATASNVGPLVFLQHAAGQNVTASASSTKAMPAMQQTCPKKITTKNNQHRHLNQNQYATNQTNNSVDEDGADDYDGIDDDNNLHEVDNENDDDDENEHDDNDENDDDDAYVDDDDVHRAYNSTKNYAKDVEDHRLNPDRNIEKMDISPTTLSDDNKQLMQPSSVATTSSGNNSANVINFTAIKNNNHNLDNCNANVCATNNSSSSSNNQTTTNINTNTNANLNANIQTNTLSRLPQHQSHDGIVQTHNQNANRNQNIQYPNSNSIQSQNSNISSSLEIILSPIIQSSRRAQ